MREFVGVALLGAEDGGHELDRVVGFQIGGAVAEHRVGGGVRFVEAVLGEFLEQGEDGLGGLAVDVVGLFCAVDEDLFLGVHDGLDLLTHGAAEDVRAAEGVAGDDLGGLHDLLLIDEDAVGFFDEFFEQWVRDLDGRGVFFAFDELGDELHRARAVEGDERDDLFEGAEADLSAELLHAAGLQLEDGGGAAGVEQVEGGLVVERTRSMSKSGRLRVARTFSCASEMTVRVLSPRKSILSRPRSSDGPLGYCVVRSPS